LVRCELQFALFLGAMVNRVRHLVVRLLSFAMWALQGSG
jgi:hypothetical protein